MNDAISKTQAVGPLTNVSNIAMLIDEEPTWDSTLSTPITVETTSMNELTTAYMMKAGPEVTSVDGVLSHTLPIQKRQRLN